MLGVDAEKRGRARCGGLLARLFMLESDMLPSADMVWNGVMSLTLPCPIIGCAAHTMRSVHAMKEAGSPPLAAICSPSAKIAVTLPHPTLAHVALLQLVCELMALHFI